MSSESLPSDNGQRRDLEDIGLVLDRMGSDNDKANQRAHEWMDRFDSYVARMNGETPAAQSRSWLRVK